MIHGWDSVECRPLRLWKKQELPDTRLTFMVFLSVCALRWTFTAGGLVFIISAVSTLMAESLSPLKSSRLILILTTCVTRRTHVCFPFFCVSLAHARWLHSCLQSRHSEMKMLSQKCWLFWICSSCARYDGFIVTFWYDCWLKVWSGKYSLFEMCSCGSTAIRIVWQRQKHLRSRSIY